MNKQIDLVVIGGGPAGMAAAIEAYNNGISDILLLERDDELGGILEQCIHNGFGLHLFNEELTGPEYAARFIDEIESNNIPYMLGTMVLNITNDKIITAVNSIDGIFEISAKSIILAMGCREKTRGALNIPGNRPSGIFSAGTAQRFVNIEGYLPGKEVVILGSGDIGLIMARRLSLEGAKVKMVCELLPYSSGLTRNIVQCLNDFNIPLKLRHTVVNIHGKERLYGVTIAQVGENFKPIEGTEEFITCDTLLLSVGLIPENELSREADVDLDLITSGPIVKQTMETSISGIFACGNVVHVHDLVDNVTVESRIAGKSASNYIKKTNSEEHIVSLKTLPGNGVRYIVPQIIETSPSSPNEPIKFLMRCTNIYCNVSILVKNNSNTLLCKKRKKVTPGEMEEITLDFDIIKRLDYRYPLLIEIEEA